MANAIEWASLAVGKAVIAQRGKTALPNRIVDRVGKRVGTGLYMANRALHWREPYGKWMDVHVPEDMPGKDIIPRYYKIAFHGQPNGYLSRLSAETYDMGVSFVFRGKDSEMRARLLDRVQGRPRKILDVGCGTGVSTEHLARRFPDAEIAAVDLSPYFVEHARKRLARKGIENVEVSHAKGEDVPFDDGAFDLVASTFVFHEVPVPFTRRIVQEAHRVLRPGGQIAICDAAQVKDFRYADLFHRMLWEPYFKKYARMSWPDVLTGAGFERPVERPTYTFGVAMSKTVAAWKPAA